MPLGCCVPCCSGFEGDTGEEMQKKGEGPCLSRPGSDREVSPELSGWKSFASVTFCELTTPSSCAAHKSGKKNLFLFSLECLLHTHTHTPKEKKKKKRKKNLSAFNRSSGRKHFQKQKGKFSVSGFSNTVVIHSRYNLLSIVPCF